MSDDVYDIECDCCHAKFTIEVHDCGEEEEKPRYCPFCYTVLSDDQIDNEEDE